MARLIQVAAMLALASIGGVGISAEDDLCGNRSPEGHPRMMRDFVYIDTPKPVGKRKARRLRRKNRNG